MFLEQICPGQVNSQPQAIHTFVYKEDRFIVYATGSKVVIYADPDNLVQIIAASSIFKRQQQQQQQQQQQEQEHFEPVNAVAGNSNTGQIAISYYAQVAVLKPCQRQEQIGWEFEALLDTSLVVTCLDWSIQNILLSAGKEIKLWKFDENESTWRITCSKSPATDITLAKFEPKSNVFATMCKFDRLVTIWYPTKDDHDAPAAAHTASYNFTLISHPKYVTHFVWRRLPGINSPENDCTLFTMACDGIGRFWSPTDLDHPQFLYMCAVIDSNQSLVTSLVDDSNHRPQDCSSSDDGETEDFSPIHYIGCDELSSAVHAKFRSHSKHERFDQRVERIRERVRDTPDLLFRIQADGSLTFWGVQHLNSVPRRIPRVFVVLRVDKAIDPLDVIYFLNPTLILHDYSHIQSASTIKPIELSLVARNPHGQLRCYSLNLIDFLDSTSFSPRLHLKYTWLGHQHSISKLYQTQKNRFCTIGVDGQINVWKYELRETCGKMTTQLQLDCSLFVESETLLAAPVDKDKFLAVYDGKHVKLYEFDNHDSHLHHSIQCDNKSVLELSSLHVYNFDDPETGEKSFLLIGVSTTLKQISTWHLTPNSLHHLDIAFRGTQTMPWSADPDVVGSASQWATNTASKLFHRLAAQKRSVLAVSLGSEIIFYSANTDSTEIEWTALYSIDTCLVASKIYQIKCAPSTVALVSGDDHKTLSIWMEMRSGVAPGCIKTFHFNEPVRDIAWNVTSDAQFILAIAFPRSVGIFGQKRASNNANNDDIWTCYTTFKVDTPEDITALAWVDCGVLTVAAGNQLRCYLKWLIGNETISSDVKVHENRQIEPMSSIFDISYEMNGPLPFYHPDHLIHYIMWGKMDLVHDVLISLNNFFKQFVDDEENTINEFPPLSFSKMLKLQNNKPNKSAKQEYNRLFKEDDDDTENSSKIQDDSDDGVRLLTTNEAKNLAHCLKVKVLPGLNENERTHLIAMVDTIVEIASQGESLDENGARFTALLENHFHLNKSLPQDQRQMQLECRDFVWALHSQSQDLLLERCIRLCDNKLVWEDARHLGLFVWLQKIDVVRDQMSNIARNIYLSKSSESRDPVDCTLFYLALRKKTLLEGLWKTASSHKEQAAMRKFLANDFTDPRWQRAASKNAFALLGKQRFEYAAAFFLLADKVKDAVSVVLKNMKDYQLAIAICRVYEGDDSLLLKEILENSIIPMAIENNDRWLISMAYWLLGKRRESVRAMVVPLSQFTDKDIDTSEADSAAVVHDPNAFILYHHLKKTLGQDQKSIVSYNIEYGFSLLVSRSYERLGCPLLALYILTRFYMKPPSANTETPPQESRLERAQDLFGSPGTTASPAHASDIFGSDDLQKPSRASDLFADDDTDLFAEPQKPSYSSNLFDDDNDDLFTTKKPAASSGGLFDDDEDDDNNQDLYASTNVATATVSETADEECIDTSEKEYDGLDGFKALLVIRMLQTFFHAATALYNGLQQPDDAYECVYRSHFLRNRQALLDLGESVKIPPDIFSRLLMEKSIETDVFPLYLYILNESIPKDFDVHQFLRAFKVGCFEVNEIALMPQELDYATLVFVENWTEHVIETFPIWNDLRARYCNPETAASTTRQIALTTFLSSILIALQERHYESCWPLIYHFKFFLEALGSNENDAALTNCFAQLKKNDAKMVDMMADDFESFSEGSMFGFDMNEEIYRPLLDSKDKSVGAYILEVATLNYVSSAIEHAMQCQGRHSSLSEQLSDFIWTTLLDPVAYRVHCLKEKILLELKDDLTRHNVLRQFKTLRQKKYWHSIKSLSSFDRLLPFVNAATSSINILADDQFDQFHSVYHSASTVYAFSLNSSTKDTMAVCLKSEIQEIDLTKAMSNIGTPLIRTRSASSSGLGQDHHIDSYPDTEEDDTDLSDNDHDSVHTNTTVKQAVRKPFPAASSSRVSGTSTPLISPAGSRTFDDHAHKVPQSLNLEHLHDSLRRSLTKGSDSARTPANTSPAPIDNAEREKMISLRRNVSASCAETHPQYPFYITGCEVNHGGPSAILWQFGQEREIASYYGCQGKATRIHFDQFGQKFGAGDTSGNLCLWRFDAHAHSNKPYYTLNCHAKATRDFTFIDSSSLIATAGTSVTMGRSSKRDHICLWDTLLPPSKAMVSALPGHESGAYAITYEPNSQLLFSGGKKGEIVVSDLRQRSTTMHTFTAHQSRIRSITIDPQTKSLITGSIDGELKIWDVSTYKLRQSFDIQPRNRFLAPTFNRIPLKAFGVTQIELFNDDIYTSGPNGIIKCKRSFVH
ncbi:RAVE protein 1 C terminal-domain-containing protein [Parasitella parasitica]|nr:RAVE protein 1 C terminal-domain-containing protein [Parasitella parasitica]